MREVRLIAFTRVGCELARELTAAFGGGARAAGPERFADAPGIDAYDTLEGWTARAFAEADALVFVGAAGIAVRAIAPHVRDKMSDPAVVCVDEQGRVAVPLLSGHVGRANDLARAIARATGGTAAVSTATDLNGAFAIDEFARDHGLAISNRELAKRISAALLAGEEVTIGGVSAAVGAGDGYGAVSAACAGVDASADANAATDALRLVPRDVVVGVGCRRGAACEAIAAAVDAALGHAGIDPLAVSCLATIDVKSDEPGLAQLSRDRAWPLSFFSADELGQVEGDFEESAFVRDAVGVGNVCERAAMLAAGPGAAIVAPKAAHDGVTVALARSHACRLFVVGIGPGASDVLTPQARRAIQASDLVVGYTTYLKLLEDEFPGKEMRATGMRAEVERCRLALEEAAGGRTVALVCSGDAGVYGMASPCLELAGGYPQVQVEVVPGVTAASSGAALLGAPLSHDFAVVSLSDLLTPWQDIEERLDAASRADFCLCLYNPASRKRPDHLRRACDVLLRAKSPQTVCGLARNIGREGEGAQVLTLAELRDAEVDMFTTVFVGNSATRVVGGRMVTPRGYLPIDCAPGADVLVFGGTAEARELVGRLAKRGCSVVVSSATEYGASLVRGDCVDSLVGRLGQEEMLGLMRSREFDCVIDATHPYAVDASRNIALAAEAAGLPCHRVARDLGWSAEMVDYSCADVREAARIVAGLPGNALLTTGTKDLGTFVSALPDAAERLYVRILPVRESLDTALDLGIPASHIVAMQGPFSLEVNVALIRSLGISVLVTKASGAVGGFQQKVEAARACGVALVVVEPPREATSPTSDSPPAVAENRAVTGAQQLAAGDGVASGEGRP